MGIKIAGEEDTKLWDDIVTDSPQGTIFHKWNFLKIMEKHTDSRLYPLVGFKSRIPIGLIPLFYQKKYGVKIITSPSFSQTYLIYLGPLLADSGWKQRKRESILKKFQKDVDEFVFRKIGANYVSIKFPPGFIDTRPYNWANYQSEPDHTYIIDLSDGLDTVWSRFDHNLRNHIRSSEKRGIYVEEGSKKDIDFIYSSLLERLNEQGKTLPVSKDYLLDLYDSFFPDFKVFLVKYRGKNIGGQILLSFKDRVIQWIGTFKTGMKGVSPNDVLGWENIKWAGEHGFKYYENLGAEGQTHSVFKAKYNPNLVLFFRATKYHPSIVRKLINIQNTIKGRI